MILSTAASLLLGLQVEQEDVGVLLFDLIEGVGFVPGREHLQAHLHHHRLELAEAGGVDIERQDLHVGRAVLQHHGSGSGRERWHTGRGGITLRRAPTVSVSAAGREP